MIAVPAVTVHLPGMPARFSPPCRAAFRQDRPAAMDGPRPSAAVPRGDGRRVGVCRSLGFPLLRRRMRSEYVRNFARTPPAARWHSSALLPRIHGHRGPRRRRGAAVLDGRGRGPRGFLGARKARGQPNNSGGTVSPKEATPGPLRAMVSPEFVPPLVLSRRGRDPWGAANKRSLSGRANETYSLVLAGHLLPLSQHAQEVPPNL